MNKAGYTVCPEIDTYPIQRTFLNGYCMMLQIPDFLITRS